jgi:hypothetical protein
MTSKSPSFQLKAKDGATRLIWRDPFTDPKTAAQLGPVLLASGEAQPNSVTLGKYATAGGEVCFIPASTPLALVALGLPVVGQRIGRDLSAMLQQGPPAVQDRAQVGKKEPSRRVNITITPSRQAIAERLGGGKVSRGIAAALDLAAQPGGQG